MKITVATPSVSGNADSVIVNVLAAGAGALAGQVIDGASGAGLADVTLQVFDAQDVLATTTTTASDGSYSTIPLVPGLYRIVASLNGFLGTTLFDATLQGGGASTVPTIPLVPSSTSPGSMSGVVKDATNNLPIAGATVEFRDGVNATTSTPVGTTTTDSLVGYSFSGPPGTYTVGAAGHRVHRRIPHFGDSGGWLKQQSGYRCSRRSVRESCGSSCNGVRFPSTLIRT